MITRAWNGIKDAISFCSLGIKVIIYVDVYYKQSSYITTWFSTSYKIQLRV